MGEGGEGKGSAEEDTFPFASHSCSTSPLTTVTSTGGGTSDGTGFRRATGVPGAVQPLMPEVVVLTSPAAPPLIMGGPPDAPSTSASCDRPASRTWSTPPFGTSALEGNVAGSKMGEPATADEPADVGGVLVALVEGF